MICERGERSEIQVPAIRQQNEKRIERKLDEKIRYRPLKDYHKTESTGKVCERKKRTSCR